MTEEFKKVKSKICGEVMGADESLAHEKTTGHNSWALMGLIPGQPNSEGFRPDTFREGTDIAQ